MSNTRKVLLLVVVAAIATAAALLRRGDWLDDRMPDAATLPPGVLTLAATGDAVVTAPLPAMTSDRGLAATFAVIRQATLAVTNLELVLLDEPRVPALGAASWPTGAARDAQLLADLGFDHVARANNHAGDHAAAGLAQTSALLESAGLTHAGAGVDGDGARAPRVVATPAGRVAFLAVATSVAADARASRGRGDIRGRSGVSALRIHANITVDPPTFAVLGQAAPTLQPDAQVGDGTLTLFGRTITKGDRTVVEFSIDATDVAELLAAIGEARRTADIVVLSLHSHEPSNGSDLPADFVRRFAHQAIDAGADLVIGHGPHRLRGIEVRGRGVILHSLGNFVFPYEPLAARAADVFDAGVDLYALALGAVETPASPTPAPLDRPEWWEGVVAVATFDRHALRRVQLHPVDLGVDLPAERRGLPRTPAPDRAAAILTRLAALSQALGTTVRTDGATGVVEIPGASAAASTRTP